MAGPSALEPSPPEDRLAHIDVVRGFALLGVLLSNIHFWFRAPRGHQNLSYSAWPGLANDIATWLVRALVEAKFIFLFSILFGVGLAMQAERARERGASFGGFAVRRLLALGAIGGLHVVLLWNGEILLPYAVTGLLALLFVRRSRRALMRWVVGLWVLIVVLMLAGRVRTLLGDPQPVPGLDVVRAIDLDEGEAIARLARGYLASAWLEVTRFRILDYGRVLADSAAGILMIFINLLTGMAIWRSGLWRDPAPHLPRLRRFIRWGVPVGLLLNAVYASKAAIRVWGWSQPWSVRRWLPAAVDLSMMLGALVLSLAIGAGLVVLAQDPRWRRRLEPLAALGRTALSAYLLQSLAMTAVFYGWGLGYYNHMSPFAGAVLGVAFFAFQLLVSVLWLRHFRFGPAEWAWRCVTYARVQPFAQRRSAARAPAGE